MDAFSDARFILGCMIPLVIGVLIYIFQPKVTEREWGWSTVVVKTPLKMHEIAIVWIICVLVNYGLWYMFRDGQFNRTEQINGVYVSKDSALKEWQTSYSCNCTSSTDSDGNTTTHCQTCYEDHYGEDFFALNSTGDWWPGCYQNELIEYNPPVRPSPPEWWKSIQIGQPVSLDHTYVNYLAPDKATPLIPPKEPYEKYAELIPPFPWASAANPYNPYLATKDKVLTIGFESPDLETWNFAPSWYNFNMVENSWEADKSKFPSAVPLYVDTTLGFLGPHFQADTYYIFVNDLPTEFVEATLAYWRLGPKNGVYLYFFGHWDGQTFTVNNFRTEFGVPSNFDFQAKLQSRMNKYFLDGGTLDREKVISIVVDQMIKPADNGGFNRKEMKDYIGNKRGIHPEPWQISVSIVVVLVLSVLGYLFFYAVDFEDMV